MSFGKIASWQSQIPGTTSPSRQVLSEERFHPSAQRARGNGAAAAERRNAKRGSGADIGDTVWRLQARVELSVEVEASALASLEMEIQQVLSDLNLSGKVVVEKERR